MRALLRGIWSSFALVSEVMSICNFLRVVFLRSCPKRRSGGLLVLEGGRRVLSGYQFSISGFDFQSVLID